ncbi:hypothetical protein [Roseixanthobacter glucoisosaccharinicivorans]|uniref:hypothetical protein n=1 Tax=Roseixanthobacter glucoisosaccharinicivorans TaxID=3119923 RepID=UPI00372BCDED
MTSGPACDRSSRTRASRRGRGAFSLARSLSAVALGLAAFAAATLAPAFLSPAAAGPAGPAGTLCNADEAVIFSCPAGARTLSICASGDLGGDSGVVLYRYGRPGRLEITYPDPAVPPVQAFTAGRLMFAGGGGAWFRFEKGPFRYTVFNAIGRWNPKGGPLALAGVAVEKDGKALADIACDGDPVSVLGSDFFERAGIKLTGDFEIPEAFFPK